MTMSQSEVERFVEAMKSDPALLKEVTSNAAGIGSVVEIARGRGYDISIDEAKSYVQRQSSVELSDDQLEAVAGGKGSSTSTASVQTTVQVTTEAVVAETTVEAAAEVEVGAVAVAVIVLT